jgi:hypothetical protein
MEFFVSISFVTMIPIVFTYRHKPGCGEEKIGSLVGKVPGDSPVYRETPSPPPPIHIVLVQFIIGGKGTVREDTSLTNSSSDSLCIMGRNSRMYRGRIQRKTWCIWDPMPELTLILPYVDSKSTPTPVPWATQCQSRP